MGEQGEGVQLGAWDEASGYRCGSHPEQPAVRACEACGRPFCESCLTELLGKSNCGWCRDLQLAQLSGAVHKPPASPKPVNPAAIVRWARVLCWVNFAGILMAGLLVLTFDTFVTPVFSRVMPESGLASEAWVSLLAIGQLVVGAAMYLPPAIGLGAGRGWAWTWNCVALVITAAWMAISQFVTALAMMTLCTGLGQFLSVVMLMYWFRQDVRAYCGRE